MQKIQETWERLPQNVATHATVFFKEAYGFDLDSENRTHIQHLSAIKEFLNQKVGKDAYTARHDGVVKYVKWNVQKMNVGDKIQHVLNENIGREVTVNEVQEMIIAVFDISVHRTQISQMLKFLCERIPSAERKDKSLPGKSGREFFYTFPDTVQDSDVKVVCKKYYKRRYQYNKVKSRKKAPQTETIQEVTLFCPEDFIKVNGKIVAAISKEHAERAEKLFSSALRQLKDVKTRMAEIIDENQQLNTKIRILTEVKVTSISDRLDEIEKQI